MRRLRTELLKTKAANRRELAIAASYSNSTLFALTLSFALSLSTQLSSIFSFLVCCLFFFAQESP